MDFMRLRMNYSKRCSRRRFPQRVSIDPNLSRSVTISLSECKDIFVGVTRGVSSIPSVYAGMQFSTCCKPSDQPRDTARWEECSGLDEKSLTTFCRCDGRAKGIAREHQNGFL
jgi:hypothetical protein